MKKSGLEIIGLIMVSLGILGFLFLGTSISGYAIKNDDNSQFQFSSIKDSNMKENERKTLTLNVKNLGKTSANNCLLSAKGTTESWIHTEQTENIQLDQSVDFKFDITIPQYTEIGEYPAELELTCDNKSGNKKFFISVTKGVNAIKIREIKIEDSKLDILYSFNNERFIGETTFVEIWVRNPDGFEIKRIIDEFPIKTDNLILRNVKIEMPKKAFGVYNVYISHPSDSENYIKKSVIFGKSHTSGNIVFKVVEGKGVPYIAFLLIIGVGVYFIFRRHRKNVQKGIGPSAPSRTRNT